MTSQDGEQKAIPTGISVDELVRRQQHEISSLRQQLQETQARLSVADLQAQMHQDQLRKLAMVKFSSLTQQTTLNSLLAEQERTRRQIQDLKQSHEAQWTQLAQQQNNVFQQVATPKPVTTSNTPNVAGSDMAVQPQQPQQPQQQPQQLQQHQQQLLNFLASQASVINNTSLVSGQNKMASSFAMASSQHPVQTFLPNVSMATSAGLPLPMTIGGNQPLLTSRYAPHF